MRLNAKPMILNLRALKEEGEEFHFDRSSEEFAGVLDDIIGDREFSVDLEVQRLGNSFQVRGRFATSYGDCCSQCGYDLDVKVADTVNEILVIEKERINFD